MLKHPAAIRTIICFLCLLSLILGCDQQAEAPPKPKVITKKIVAKKKTAVPQKIQKVDAVKPEIKKQAPEPKAAVATKQMPEPKTVAVIKQMPKQKPAAVVKKMPKPKTAPVVKQMPKPETETVAKQMPKPKTIIAATQSPEPKVKTQLAAVTTQAESEAKDKKLVASLAPTVQKLVLRDSADVYIPQGKLDPFEPLFQEKAAAVVLPREKTIKRKPLTPLEKLDLSQLQLVGVIRSLSGNRALVEDAAGKGYVVTKGTYIGTRSGKIVDILADRIIVAEEVENMYGKVSVQKRPLIIQKPPGE